MGFLTRQSRQPCCLFFRHPQPSVGSGPAAAAAPIRTPPSLFAFEAIAVANRASSCKCSGIPHLTPTLSAPNLALDGAERGGGGGPRFSPPPPQGGAGVGPPRSARGGGGREEPL